MASAKLVLNKVSEQVLMEHAELTARLKQLDSALDAIICHAEVYADLAASSAVVDQGRWLSTRLPGHFRMEEDSILAAVECMGPDYAAFSSEMKRQHEQLGKRIEAFCRAADQLAGAQDLEQSICDLKDEGKRFTDAMTAHMGAEERKFAAIQ